MSDVFGPGTTGGLCKGTIIASKYIVTAEHCVAYKNGTVFEPEKIIVAPDQSGSKRIYVSRVEVAAEFRDRALLKRLDGKYDGFSDIALLELTRRLDLNTYTPACLAQNTERFEGKHAEALVLRNYTWYEGWTLINLHTPIVEIEYCFQWMRSLGFDAYRYSDSELLLFTYFVPGWLCSVEENNEFIRKVNFGKLYYMHDICILIIISIRETAEDLFYTKKTISILSLELLTRITTRHMNGRKQKCLKI